MPSNLTKSAVLIAMRVAAEEGDRDEWHALDQLYASMLTGKTYSLALAGASLAQLDPYDLDHGDTGGDDDAQPAWARPDDGGRTR